MKHPVSVDAPPALDWLGSRPAGLHPHLWAAARPTDSTLASLALPEGTAVYGTAGQLLGWTSHDGVSNLDEIWLTCAQQFPHTGMWPICDDSGIDSTRGWNFLTEDGKAYWQDPYALPDDVYDAVNIADRADYFAPELGPDYFRELMEDLGVRDSSKTLASASALPPSPLSRLVLPERPDRLTLVACQRPSDAVLLLDFGVANDDATPGIFAGVLRSWETRFGLVPVQLTPGWTAFQIIAPPTEDVEVERLAAEVVAFATDSACQGGFHIRRGPSVSAQEMVRSSEWLIWWD